MENEIEILVKSESIMCSPVKYIPGEGAEIDRILKIGNISEEIQNFKG